MELKFLVDERYIWEEYTATVWTEVKTNSIGVKSENHIMYGHIEYQVM